MCGVGKWEVDTLLLFSRWDLLSQSRAGSCFSFSGVRLIFPSQLALGCSTDCSSFRPRSAQPRPCPILLSSSSSILPIVRHPPSIMHFCTSSSLPGALCFISDPPYPPISPSLFSNFRDQSFASRTSHVYCSIRTNAMYLPSSLIVLLFRAFPILAGPGRVTGV